MEETQSQKKKSPKKLPNKGVENFARYSGIAFQMIGIILITTWGGTKLDKIAGFEKPVFTRDEGYAEASAKRLAAHAAKVYSDYANAPELSFTIGDALIGMGEQLPLNKLLERLEAELNSRLENGGN